MTLSPEMIAYLMRPRYPAPSDLQLIRDIIFTEEFRLMMGVELGEPIEIQIRPDDNLVTVRGPKGDRFIDLDLLVAHERGQVH